MFFALEPEEPVEERPFRAVKRLFLEQGLFSPGDTPSTTFPVPQYTESAQAGIAQSADGANQPSPDREFGGGEEVRWGARTGATRRVQRFRSPNIRRVPRPALHRALKARHS